MRSTKQDLPVAFDAPPMKVQVEDWGNFETQILTYKVDTNLAPLLKGLPDDRCQTPHWGYILKGSVHVLYADREEVLNTGDLFYMSPGHSPIIEAGTEMLPFSPLGPVLEETTQAIQKNMAAILSGVGGAKP